MKFGHGGCMNKPYIICVEDEIEVRDAVVNDLRFEFRKNFNIEACESAEEALELTKELDSKGEEIFAYVADHVMPGTKGIPFLSKINKIHPKSKKILLTAARAEKNDLIEAINNMALDKYIDKPWKKEELYSIIDVLNMQYKLSLSPKLRLGDRDLIIKEAETQHELVKAFELRYAIYVEDPAVRYLLPEQVEAAKKEAGEFVDKKIINPIWDVSELEKIAKLEYDKYDLKPSTKHIVGMKKGECVGYVRLVEGDTIGVPIEKGFSIEEERNKNRRIREASRYVINREYRASDLRVDLWHLVYQLSIAGNDLYCTSTPHMERYYKKMGFVPIGNPKEGGVSKDYNLRGEWKPMHLDMAYVMRNYKNMPDVNNAIIEMITRVDAPIIKIEFGDKSRLSKMFLKIKYMLGKK